VSEADPGYQKVRLLLAGGILLGGMTVASFFRRTSPVDEARAALPAGRSEYALADSGPSSVNEIPAVRADALLAPSRVATPSDAASAPKATQAKPTPDAAKPAAASPARPGPLRMDEAVRIHKVVDGDSLGSLAERYLGGRDRWREIFEANDRTRIPEAALTDPEALPIGAELRIPLRLSQRP
jgi:nucleoid-associated protein YgaU